jgi:flagellar hook-basal body complex protein FliE
MITPVSGLPPLDAQPSSGAQTGPSGGSADSGFLDTLRTAVDQANQLQTEADSQVASMLNGNGQDVHSAMIAVEKANLTFELMLQVRNKIISAYQEVSRIPF